MEEERNRGYLFHVAQWDDVTKTRTGDFLQWSKTTQIRRMTGKDRGMVKRDIEGGIGRTR